MLLMRINALIAVFVSAPARLKPFPAKTGETTGRYGKGLTLAFFFLLFFCLAGIIYGDEEPQSGISLGDFPVITRLDWRDEGFQIYTAGVEASRRRIFNRDRTRENARSFANSLAIYQYTPRAGEDIFHLAARSSVPYSALVSLNRINSPSALETGKPILLPTVPGIFVPENPKTDLEQLLVSGRLHSPDYDSIAITLKGAAGEPDVIFHFIPGGEFNSTERAFFLHSGFRFPLRNFRLTSGFGMRRNPVTGNHRMHQGLDLAAPAGTEVFATAAGIVTEVGNDPIYGIYVIISHNNNWVSLYGHLQRAGVTLHSRVNSGSLIGWVGSTGQSTGPHLHFELRQHGRAQDPGKYLFLPHRQ